MKTTLSFLFGILFSNVTIAQTTAIPDANFEQALINLGYDTGVPDGSVPTANINSVNSLTIYSKNINDLTGIEDFTDLTTLECSSNSLTNLDLSQNLNLEYLSCYNSDLISLNLTQNTELNWLDCADNLLTSLDVSQNTKLVEFRCYNNQINSLDVSNNLNLKNLRFQNNQITGGMNLSQHTQLNYLDCHNNSLYSLNVKNGNNIYFYAAGFNAMNNPNLTCIEVDDSTWASTNWANRIDTIANFSNNCNNNAILTTLPTLTICSGDSSLIFGIYQSTSGNYYNHLTSTLGYDSIVSQPLTILPLNINNQNTSICSGDSSLIYGNYQTNAGIYYDTLQSTFGCDSILSTTLTINPIFNTNTNQSIWLGDSLLIYGNYQNMAGIYYDSLHTYLGCDSIVSTTLSVNPCNTNADFEYTENSNGSYSFTNNSTGDFNQVHWAFGNGNSSTSTASDPSYTYITNGTYLVVLSIAIDNSCFDYYLDTIVVTGVPSPTQCASGFVMYPDTTTGDITVVNSSTGTNLTYLWDFGDGNTSTQQFPSHTYATAGPFYLCLTVDDGNGCLDMYCDSIGENGVVFNKQAGFTINIIAPPVITGIANTTILNSKISFYPNPTSNQLNIVSNQLNISQINIADVTGKTVNTFTTNTNQIDVSKLPSGIYFIKFITNEKTITKKFIKQ